MGWKQKVLLLRSRGDNTTLVSQVPLARLLWRSLHATFNISPPHSVDHLFRDWLSGVESNIETHIRVGVCELI